MDWFTRRGRGRPPHPDILTPAEWRVLEGVREGRQNAEIAADLGVSVNTVRTHVSSMLGKLDLPDRHALAAWDGEPAPVTSRALGRFGLAAPWLRIAAPSAAVLALVAMVWVALDGGRGGAAGGAASSPVPAATEETPVAAAPRAASGSPYRVDFAPGEAIDVWPAVVFVDLPTMAATAWVFPNHQGEFGVPPSGDYIVWSDGVTRFLLDTRTESTHAMGGRHLPIAFGPGDAGFVASDDGFLYQVYAPSGAPAGLGGWRAAPARPVVAAWSPDGSAVAFGQSIEDDRALVGITARGGTTASYPAMSPSGQVNRFDVPAGTSISLRWSHDSNRLAVVSADRVRVVDRGGVLLWEQAGGFHGNPRWSPDDAHLYVNAQSVDGADLAYMFGGQGELLWRFATRSSAFVDSASQGWGCSGERWLDADHIGIGSFAVSTAGEVTDLREPSVHRFVRLLSPTPTKVGVPLASGVPWQPLRNGDDRLPLLEDGRLAFATTDFWYSGCANGLSVAGVFEEGLERPPFDD